MRKLKRYSGQTHQGPHLQINEDDFDVDLTNNLYMVFDGFGGSGIGDRTVARLKENIKSLFLRISGDPDSTMPFYFSAKHLIEGNALINALHFAHQQLKKENDSREMSARGGSSFLGAALSESILTMVSCGNCMSFLYRKGHLLPLTTPDTLCPLPLNRQHALFANHPLSALGLFDHLHLQTRELKLEDDDIIIMTTDGPYLHLDQKEIKFIIENQTMDAQDKIKEIFRISNERGNRDNQTTIFLHF